NQVAVDGMIHDGLWDVYNNFHMGTAAELCAREKKIDRAMQDAYAIESFKRALAAQKSGAFNDEIVAVEVAQRKGPPKRVELDEGPGRGDIEKIPSLKPAFAVVAIANNQLLGLDPKKVNVHGGAVALGHPIGASGARILTTLIYALQAQGKKRGVASLCIGGGEAVALVVER